MKLRPGDRALVTGASRGIGRELACQLANRGVDLVLLARSEDQLHELAANLSHVRCTVLPCDLRLRLPTEDEVGPIDVLVNNAGFGSFGRLDGIDLAWVTGMIEVNVGAVAGLTRLLTPQMIERRRGGVLNVASTVGFQPIPYLAEYAATKAFVLSFSQALHHELAPLGVTVTALCPGVTDTRFHRIAGTPRGPRFLEQTAEQVARTGLRGLERGRSTIVSGGFNKIGARLAEVTPGVLSAAVTGRAMRPFADGDNH